MTEEQKDNIISILRFVDYTVDHVEFTRNSSFESESVNISFSINHKIKWNGSDAHVTLDLEVFKDAQTNNYPFSISVSVTGHFQVEDAEPELIQRLLNGNAIAILFPYLRALVSTYTANANLPALILPPINVANYLQQKQEEREGNQD